MNNAIYENLSKAGKSSYDSAKELYEINTNIAEQIIEQQLAIGSVGDKVEPVVAVVGCYDVDHPG